MKKALLMVLAVVFASYFHSELQAQCENPSVNLPDANHPVNGNIANAYCVTITFDPAQTGIPTGMSMEIFHTWQGDLSIFIAACGNTLNIMQRPGVIGSCGGSCPCGNSNDLGTASNPALLIFQDGGGPDPENGIPLNGGTFDVTDDNSCPYGTPGITSFASLWAGCPPGPISAQICIADHAFSDAGYAQNITLLFPDPIVCGCTDPTAGNYDPNADVDDGSCIPPCANFAVAATPTASVCSGASTQLSATVTGGLGPSYQWVSPNGGEAYLDDPTSPTPTVSIPEGVTGTFTYIVMVNDPPCMGEATVNVTVLNPPSPQIIGEAVVCPNQSTQLNVTGGIFTDYQWSTGDSNPSIQAGPGEYTITVTGTNGCQGSASFTITEADPPAVDVTGPPDICPGGVASLSATPGYLTYDWSTGDFGAVISVFNPGIYTVTVTDQDGCTGVGNYYLEPGFGPDVYIDGDIEICSNETTSLQGPPGMAAYSWSTGEITPSIQVNEPGVYSLFVLDDEGCPGEADIFITQLPDPIPVIDGIPAFCAFSETILSVNEPFLNYQWSTGDIGPNAVVFAPGLVSVTVTDSEGCMGSADIEVSEIPNPQPVISGPLGICPEGIVTLSADEGFLIYDWSTGQGTSSIQADLPGLYGLTVTDDYGCSGSTTYELQPYPVSVPQISGQLTICPGGATILTASPGFQSYFWSNGATTTSTQFNAPGEVTLITTDENGCQSIASVVIQQQDQLSPVILGDLDFCAGSSTTLSVEGSYTSYTWSTGATDASISVSTATAVSVTVTDAFGCSGATTVSPAILPLPQPLIGGSLSFCAGSSTTLSSTLPFAAYNWSTGSTTNSANVSAPGSVSLTVTDNNGCVGSSSVSVLQNELPTPVISGVPGFCPGQTTQLTANSGYTAYLWSTGSTSTSIQVGSTDLYSLTVTDGNGCQGATSLQVSEYTTQIPAITGALQFCPEGSTTLSAAAGFVSYQWSNGQNGSQLLSNTPGNYSLTVTDSNGCETSNEVQLSNYTVVTPVISGPQGFCTGQTATLSTGAGYASYAWSAGGVNTADITVGNGGIYSVTVTDANGCLSDADYNLTQYSLPNPVIAGSLTFCTGTFTTLSTSDIYTSYEWSNGGSQPSTSINTQGTVVLTVVDINGCSDSTQVNVTEATELSPSIAGDPAFCIGSSTLLDAGAGFATYLWNDGSTAQSLLVTSPGVYTLSVTDASGCSGQTSITVIENPLPMPQISGIAEFCIGASTQISANAGYVSYDWNTGAFTPGITVNSAGNYSVEVVDTNGCINTTQIAVVERPLPVFSIAGADFFCAGGQTQLSVTPAQTAYQWSGGQTTNGISVSQPGLVVVTVTNEYGCRASNNINIQRIPLPDPDPGIERFLSCDVTSVTLGGGGGSQGSQFTYQWTGPGITPQNQQLPQPTVNLAGSYSLVVTNQQYGCVSLPETVAVTDLTNNPAVVLQVLDILDCNTSTVVIDGTQSAGGSAIIYQWYNELLQPIPNAPGNQLTVTNPSLFYLQVVDTITGCANIDSIEVTSNVDYPVAEAGPTDRLDCRRPRLSLDGTGSQTGSDIRYQWTTLGGIIDSGATSIQPVVAAPGWYYLRVTDISNGCNNIDSVFITRNNTPPVAVTSPNQELNCLVEGVTITGQGSSAGDIFRYQWLLNTQPIAGANTLDWFTNTAGIYTLEVLNDDNGCKATAQVLITRDETEPRGLVAQTDTPTCFGDLDGSIVVVSVDGGTPPFSYSLNGRPLAQLGFFDDLGAGTYTLSVVDAKGCDYETQVVIPEANDLQVELGPDQELTLGEIAIINAQVTVPVEELTGIKWQTVVSLPCDSCLTHELQLTESTQFYILVVDENGCTASDLVTIFVRRERDVYIPNAFSPNGDGRNDVFMPFAAPAAIKKINAFQVYNRWGEIMYEVYDCPANDPVYGWDGTHRGQFMNAGPYVWTLEVTFFDDEVEFFKGEVILMR